MQNLLQGDYAEVRKTVVNKVSTMRLDHDSSAESHSAPQPVAKVEAIMSEQEIMDAFRQYSAYLIFLYEL